MDKEIVSELRQRIIRNFMDVFILLQLRKTKMSGYGIILQIQKRFGVLMSSGTVYSTLYSMEREGLIEATSTERKRIYTLTSKGEREIVSLCKSNCEIKNVVTNMLSITGA